MADRVIVVGSTDAEVLASVEASPEFIGWHIQGTVTEASKCVGAGSSVRRTSGYGQCCTNDCLPFTSCDNGSIYGAGGYSACGSNSACGSISVYKTYKSEVANEALFFVECRDNWQANTLYVHIPVETTSEASSPTPTDVPSSGATANAGASSTSQNEPPPSGAAAQGGEKQNLTWIAGAVAGPVVFLLLVGALVWWLLRRRRKNRESSAAAVQQNSGNAGMVFHPGQQGPHPGVGGDWYAWQAQGKAISPGSTELAGSGGGWQQQQGWPAPQTLGTEGDGGIAAGRTRTPQELYGSERLAREMH